LIIKPTVENVIYCRGSKSWAPTIYYVFIFPCHSLHLPYQASRVPAVRRDGNRPRWTARCHGDAGLRSNSVHRPSFHWGLHFSYGCRIV